MKNKLNRIALGLLICSIFNGCSDKAKSYPVSSIDRNSAFSPEKKSDPLRIIIEMREDGTLSLNKIETGTIAEPDVLSEKIKVVFDDRSKNGISEREIFIDRKGEIRNEDLNKLIKVLENLKAAPVRVIREK